MTFSREFRSFEYQQNPGLDSYPATGQQMSPPSQPNTYMGQIFTPPMDNLGQMGGSNPTQTGDFPPTDPDNEPPLMEG